jgi:dihydropteroate synthase
MGIVNASPDSFSDAGAYPDLDARVRRARELIAQGADLIDVGGESAITRRPPVAVSEEIERVAPLVARLVAELGAVVSVDTYKPAVAEAAIAAGAAIVNDVSGLRDPRLADVCARTGAALVLMHTRAAPKQRLQDRRLYDDVVADVIGFLSERMEVARARGVRDEQIVLDPGPDFAKTPAQTIAVLRRLEELHALGRPLLLAVSRKDFVGALTGRGPRERLGGTLAAIGCGVDAGAHVLRVHDVEQAADFLRVRAALRGELDVDPGLVLDEAIRHAR